MFFPKFTAALVSSLLACAVLFAADAKTVDKTLPLTASGSVNIESHNGSISVRTWDRQEIEIHARIEMSSWSGVSSADRRRFDQTKVEIDKFGDSVRIRSVYPDWNLSWTSWNSPEIHYLITAPRTARWTIRDHNSRIEVHDLRAALSIHTHNSRVTVDGLAGAFELDTHNGDAHVAFASFTAASSVDMHNGDVELVLPAKSKFELHSISHNARLQSDFPLMTHTTSRRGADVDGTVNGGGPSLRLSTHNGNFRIRSN
jgi:DUF4097 and DUF4098 domain-containing protein YvlB